MIGDILVKVAKGDLLTQEEARILLEWGQALNNAPDLFGQLFKGLSSVGTLADITRDLGTVNRGAFISGNAGDPLDASGNNPFTGVAMMSPGIPVLSGADEASIFGMNEGDLMFWLSNLTGSVLAGGGRVVLNTTGVNLELGTDETDTQVAVKWFDDTDFQRSYVIGYATSPKNALQLEAQPYTGKDSEVLIKASSPSGKEGAVRIYAYEDGKPMSEVALESPGAGTVSEARLAVYDTSTNPKASIILLDDSANHASVGLAVYNDSGLNTVHAELRDDTARLEIGSNDGGDHFFPSRNAPNPNVYFNEANQDMDFIVEGTSDGALIYADAGNNRVGIGDSTPSYKLDVNGDVNIASGSAYRINGVPISIPGLIGRARLSLESGVPVSTSDQTAKTTVYWTDGTRNLSVAVPSTTNNAFDVFLDLVNGDLETVNWTNANSRATALTYADGYYVKSGDTTKLYLGTGITTGTSGQCNDSLTSRLLYNYFNRKARRMQVTGTTSHTYTDSTIRYWNNDSGMQVDFAIGIVEDSFSVLLLNQMTGATGASISQGCVGFAINDASPSALSGVSYWASAINMRAAGSAVFPPVLGKNNVGVMERGLAGVTFAVASLQMLIDI